MSFQNVDFDFSLFLPSDFVLSELDDSTFSIVEHYQPLSRTPVFFFPFPKFENLVFKFGEGEKKAKNKSRGFHVQIVTCVKRSPRRKDSNSTMYPQSVVSVARSVETRHLKMNSERNHFYPKTFDITQSLTYSNPNRNLIELELEKTPLRGSNSNTLELEWSKTPKSQHEKRQRLLVAFGDSFTGQDQVFQRSEWIEA